jgi:hypothetical protein
MRYIITIMVALIATTAVSQTAIDKYFTDFDSDDSFTSISISGKMFQLLTHIEGESDDEKEILETVSKLEGMKMLVKERVAPGEGIYRSAIKRLGSEFEELMRVEDKLENWY